jgi:GAF domain-containing protein
MLEQRLAELDRRVRDLMRGHAPMLPHAQHIVTDDSSPAGRAIRLVLSELRHDVPYDSCSVQELRGSRLVIVGGVGFADLDVLLGESFDLTNLDIPNGEVIFRRRPLIVRDTDQYRAFRRGLHVGSGIRSWLGVPLLCGERLAGMMALDKCEPDFYTAIHQQTALRFAEIAAWALEAERNADEKTG